MMEKMNVRVEFEGDLLKKLDALKAYYGVENYTDLIRLLVNDKHRQLFPKEA
jgi:hypothetical protein